MIHKNSLMRTRGGHDGGRVTYIELFFDLVFVFAVTQLSHTLLSDLSPLGWLKTGLLMLAVWWMWIDTAWITNWLDPEKRPVRVFLMVMMLGGLVLSTSLPHAFDSQAVIFGVAYGAAHVVKTGFTLWAIRGEARGTFRRMLAWHILLGAAWVAGAFAPPEVRPAIWGAAILIETGLAAIGYWFPGLGRSHASDWSSVEGGHMAERCALFIIIALGESVLVTGATFAELPRITQTIAAFLVAFLGSVAMWWIYFSNVAELGANRISHASDVGGLARSAYTYLHIPIVAGIIVTAVADERVLHHPLGHADGATTATLLIGAGLYLAGAALFKYAITGHVSPARCSGLVACLALWLAAGNLSPLALSAATTAVLVLVAAWEGWAISQGAHTALGKGEAAPAKRAAPKS